MEKERRGQLEWLLSFANLDLTEITKREKVKFLRESKGHLFPLKEMEELRRRLYSLAEGLKNDSQFREAVELIAPQMTWFFESKHEDSPEYWAEILKLQDAVKDELGMLSRSTGNLDETALAPQIGIVSEARMMVVQDWNNRKDFNFLFIPLTESNHDYLRIKMYRLLDGLPSSCIKRCLECKRFFFSLERRERKFCSPSCVLHFNAEKRKTDLEATY